MKSFLTALVLICFLAACGGSGPDGNEFEILYPKSGYSGFNLLSGEVSKIDTAADYGFIADVPGGSITKVVMENTSENLPAGPNSPGGGYWELDALQNTGWFVDDYDYKVHSQEFHCDGPIKAYLTVDFKGCGSARILIYEFRNDEPSFEYNVNWDNGCPE